MTTEQTIAPEAGVEALQAQLHDVEDAIGRITITWRQAAASPAVIEAAAERLAVLERQRDLLRAAVEQAQGEQAAVAAAENKQRLRGQIEQVRAAITPLLDARVELGRQLEEAVLRVAALIQELHDQAQLIRREWPREAVEVSGVNTMNPSFRALDSEDMHTSINQMLAWRLGSLWPEHRSIANREDSCAHRIAHEVGPIRFAFEEGAKQRAAAA